MDKWCREEDPNPARFIATAIASATAASAEGFALGAAAFGAGSGRMWQIFGATASKAFTT